MQATRPVLPANSVIHMGSFFQAPELLLLKPGGYLNLPSTSIDLVRFDLPDSQV